jgi:ribonuclease P protein component
LPFKAGNQALPIDRRIKQRKDFEQAFKAKRFTNSWFIVYARKNEFDYSRLGLVVSKKSIPKAVARNFAKRTVRELFRLEFPVEYKFDVVVRARRELNPENSAEGRQALTQLLLAMRA